MDKGKAAALLIGLAPKKPGGASPAPEAGEDSDMDGLEVAARDAFAAMKADDAAGFAEAFRSAVEIAVSGMEG